MKLNRDLREFIALLNSTGVKYLVVGGHAVAFHGHPRFTGDIDFFVEPSSENARRLVAVLGQFGFGGLGLGVEAFLEQETVVQLGRAPNRIDLLTSIDGVQFQPAWTAKVPGELDGLPVHFIAREHLLANKRASGRPQDLADLDHLQEEC
jgi:Nucleotidyl transferase of unknown function (DUF2204)